MSSQKSSNTCKLLVDTFTSVCYELGVPIADDKSVGPTTILIFLGLEIDSWSRFRQLAPEAAQNPEVVPVQFLSLISEMKLKD
ncbi:hypothetical protein ACF0H5_001798 [Mactra antiquata]